MSKFEVGDRVDWNGLIGTVSSISGDGGFPVKVDFSIKESSNARNFTFTEDGRFTSDQTIPCIKKVTRNKDLMMDLKSRAELVKDILVSFENTIKQTDSLDPEVSYQSLKLSFKAILERCIMNLEKEEMGYWIPLTKEKMIKIFSTIEDSANQIYFCLERLAPKDIYFKKYISESKIQLSEFKKTINEFIEKSLTPS